MKKPKLIDIHKAILKLGYTVEVPWEVYRTLGSKRPLEVIGEQVCLGEDYVSITEARYAIGWYVGQLGGNVDWSLK